MEHGGNHPEHHSQCQWHVFRRGKCQRVQQHVCGPGGDGEPLASVHRFRVGPAHLLPRKQRDLECARWLQLFVEQRSDFPEHHGKYKWFVFGGRFCQRLQQYFVYASSHGKSFAAEYGHVFGCDDVLPGRQRNPFCPRRIQLLVEHGSNHANDFAQYQRFVFGGGFRKRMQQYVCRSSGDGASDPLEFGGGFGAPHLLSGEQCDAVRPRRVQLSVEQWRHDSGHHGHRNGFVFCYGIGQWLQQHVDGPAGNGSSAASSIRYRFGAPDFVPRKQRDPFCTGGL